MGTDAAFEVCNPELETRNPERSDYFPTKHLARRRRNQTHTSVRILQKATKGTKGQGDIYGSLFPLLPFVKIPGFEPPGNRGG
jgi:hypothetical protein